MQKDNLVSHLARVSIKNKVSAKTNNPYYVLELEWLLPNDKTYTQSTFLTNEQIALIEQSESYSRSDERN